MRVTSEAEARQVLLDRQTRDGCVPTLPAASDTIETAAGWAFFNVHGYLGTVTDAGEVIAEPGFKDG